MSENRNTVSGWFKKWMKPNADQFKFLFTSIWFKDEKIPRTSIDGLNDLLNKKADTTSVEAIEKQIVKIEKIVAVGLQYLEAVEITANIPCELVLPDNILLYGFEVTSKANLSLGTTDTIVDDLGDYEK